MTGEPRTLYYDEVFQTYKKVVLDNFPGDVLAVLQMGGSDKLHGIEVLKPDETTYKRALATINPIRIRWLNPTSWLNPLKWTNNLNMRYDPGGYKKWKICMTMIEEEEKRRGMKYEFVVRTRPDLMIVKELPPLERWPTDRVLVSPYYECLQDLPPSYGEADEKFRKIDAFCGVKDYGLRV
ncbi:unnamed protein product [Didymodactylos carnosus]|uniref:Uncharacterized protein n=1 Tax=Didymodactylos carnosus TaxID=1234261 RepID=A0A814VS09_9BILA|nr:unnamed protein product [Didymodactylos carnosus]CAF3959264.1 unnamed protein product [Didymodactylos carnosus]